MATASICGDVMISIALGVTMTPGYALRARACAAGSISAIARTSEPSRAMRFRTMLGPQYPYPITPKFIISFLLRNYYLMASPQQSGLALQPRIEEKIRTGTQFTRRL